MPEVASRVTPPRAFAWAIPLLALILLTTTDDGNGLPAVPGEERTLWLGAEPVAKVVELWDDAGLHRRLELPTDWGADRATLEVRPGPDGFVRYARYQRRGPRGGRDVEVQVVPGRRSLRTPDGLFPIPGERPVVLLELIGLVRPAYPLEVTLLDLPSGEHRPGSLRVAPNGLDVLALDGAGHVLATFEHNALERRGPGMFAETAAGAPSPRSQAVPLHPPLREPPAAYAAVRLVAEGAPPWHSMSLDGPGQRLVVSPNVIALAPSYLDVTPPRAEHLAPAPFLEVDHPVVVDFARRARHTKSSLAAALLLAEAVHALLDLSDGGGPPSAVLALERRAGDCDDATALIVAALRAAGHSARAVVGYRHINHTLVPHAWAEVYSGDRWHSVDATLPGIGPFKTHLRLFEGLGSPFTMGRVLAVLRVVPEDGEFFEQANSP